MSGFEPCCCGLARGRPSDRTQGNVASGLLHKQRAPYHRVMAFIQVPDIDNDNTHLLNSEHIVRTTLWKGETARVHLSDGAVIEVHPKILEVLNKELLRQSDPPVSSRRW